MSDTSERYRLLVQAEAAQADKDLQAALERRRLAQEDVDRIEGARRELRALLASLAEEVPVS